MQNLLYFRVNCRCVSLIPLITVDVTRRCERSVFTASDSSFRTQTWSERRHMLCFACANTHTCSNLTLTHLHTRPMSLRWEVIHESVSSVRHNRCVCGSAVSLLPWFCPRWHVITIARVSTWFSTSLNVCQVGIYHIFTPSLTVSFEAGLLPLLKTIPTASLSLHCHSVFGL